MKFRIGFESETKENNSLQTETVTSNQTKAPRRSVVQIHFEDRNMTLTYYNDMFDLHKGDTVYVDGKLEGILGSVTQVNYNFKIRISDYHRVIAVVDTEVHGQFFIAGSHFVTFDRNALPCGKALLWFKPPVKDEDEFISGSDDTSFRLDSLDEMNITPAIAQRGHNYYLENRVRYICIDGTHGYAIVEGGEAYEVEFEYRDGEISRLVCSCYCSYNCKHEFAAMLQLKESLKNIEKNYAEKYENSSYFAAVNKATLFEFAVGDKNCGTLTL